MSKSAILHIITLCRQKLSNSRELVFCEYVILPYELVSQRKRRRVKIKSEIFVWIYETIIS
jgi:hypothetical protein